MNATPHRIDAHHHVWDLSVRDQEWLTGPELSALRRDFGIGELAVLAGAERVGATVVVQTVAAAGETPELLGLAAEQDLVGGVVGWTDLTAPDVAEQLARLRELPGGSYLAGIRHQVQSEEDPDWLVRPQVLRGLRAVAAAGLAFDLLVLPHQLRAAVRAAGELPELVFVLDHLGKPPVATGATEPWADEVCRLASRPNVTCKLSGLVTEADRAAWQIDDLRPYADTVLAAFGPDRLMFGSDWPACTLAATYGEVVASARALTMALSPSEQTAFWSGTATRVYGLPG
ncbi:amidohydrolase family protein [Streptomyces aculeolatus]|uniref:amidohydrolase family protein n=1 Tax=Streptomyces aculeolatus TaxID=270689 RepID=UPI001CEC244F|nr:amidohydrolase family protein [Streptomyces aculeolatus]